MIKLGIRQNLEIIKITSVGAFLNSKEDPSIDDVLLPTTQIPEGSDVGDEVEVFIYKDSEDRLIATVKKSKLELGQVNTLAVRDTNEFGAFLNWGLNKDLFLPFAEQRGEVKFGKKYPVILYIDNSDRLCASMVIYDRLSSDSSFFKGEKVKGIVYSINETLGAFVAVNGRYHGMIPATELLGKIKIGDEIEARVRKIRDDGKLELSLRNEAHMEIDSDAEIIMKKLEDNQGTLPYGDKTAPDIIYSELGISKKAFKRAIGRLYKERKIIIETTGIRVNSETEE